MEPLNGFQSKWKYFPMNSSFFLSFLLSFFLSSSSSCPLAGGAGANMQMRRRRKGGGGEEKKKDAQPTRTDGPEIDSGRFPWQRLMDSYGGFCGHSSTDGAGIPTRLRPSWSSSAGGALIGGHAHSLKHLPASPSIRKASGKHPESIWGGGGDGARRHS